MAEIFIQCQTASVGQLNPLIRPLRALYISRPDYIRRLKPAPVIGDCFVATVGERHVLHRVKKGFDL